MANGNWSLTVELMFSPLSNKLFLTGKESSLIGKGIFLIRNESSFTVFIKFLKGIGHLPVAIG
jgi:hypothetical protein